MGLKDTLEHLKPVYTHGDFLDQLKCEDVSIDSRALSQGSVFVALPSVWPDKPGGERFIDQALVAGAKVM